MEVYLELLIIHVKLNDSIVRLDTRYMDLLKMQGYLLPQANEGSQHIDPQ